MIYRLFESCRLISGYSRCCIYDLQRQKVKFLPKLCYDWFDSRHLLDTVHFNTISEDDREVVSNCLSDLLSQDLIFEISVDEIECFPNMNLSWDYPAFITNAVILYQRNSLKHINKTFIELQQLNCKNIQVFLIDKDSFKDVEQIQNNANKFNMQSIEYAITSEAIDNKQDFYKWVKKNNNIKNVFFHKSKSSKIISDDNSGMGFVVNTKHSMDPSNQCGNIHPCYFCINIMHFTEAQCHNTCLNRKVCIDANGDIKNCPAMSKSYGNIKDTTLEEAINKPGFKDLWFINKDKIDVCKDCEFRYMCTDCRAFIKDPENIYSQPAKCTYNPYICLWEGQEGYVPVEECGTYSRETGFVPDKKKIAKLNKEIWGED